MILKTKAMQTPDSLRPIALQTTRQKWLTNILLIQLEDVLLHCIPSQQTGFLRHKSILQHVYGSRALWDGLREGAALSVDFKNVFPTMSHEMVAAALGPMCILFLYIRLILHLLRAPYLYSVGKGYIPGVYHQPRAGTRQGDPLSPALFSLVASFVIFPLQDVGPGLTIMMYADDLLIVLDGEANLHLLGKIWKVVSCFGQFSRLKVNLNKAPAIVRNCGGMEWARCFKDIGVDVKNFVKYPGVRLGNIRHHQDDQGWGLTIEQAFAPALQEAFRRARVVSTLQLSMDERAFMLTSWILPVVGIQGILRPKPSDQAAEASIPRDHGHQQLGNHSANPLPGTDARGTGIAGARAVSHAPGSGFVHQPLGRTSQVSQQGSGDLVCMGDNNWVHTVQRQPPIYPAGHGSDGGTDVLWVVGKGTLIYPTGGPTGAPPPPPEKPGPAATVALYILPE